MMINSLFKYSIFRDEFFDNLLLRVSDRDSLNDPFEFLPSESLQKSLLGFSLPNGNDYIDNLLYSRFGIISFTETRDNLLMWSHYGDQHKGVAIEYDINHDFFKKSFISTQNPFEGVISRVLYRKERFYELSDKKIPQLELFFHKSDEWEYEKEHRLLLSLDQAKYVLINKDSVESNNDDFIDYNEHQFQIVSNPLIYREKAMFFYQPPIEAIKSVTFGCKCSPKNIEKAMTKLISKSNSISFYKAEINNKDYKLNFELI